MTHIALCLQGALCMHQTLPSFVLRFLVKYLHQYPTNNPTSIEWLVAAVYKRFRRLMQLLISEFSGVCVDSVCKFNAKVVIAMYNRACYHCAPFT
jgi:hypothetical protein